MPLNSGKLAHRFAEPCSAVSQGFCKSWRLCASRLRRGAGSRAGTAIRRKAERAGSLLLRGLQLPPEAAAEALSRLIFKRVIRNDIEFLTTHSDDLPAPFCIAANRAAANSLANMAASVTQCQATCQRRHCHDIRLTSRIRRSRTCDHPRFRRQIAGRSVCKQMRTWRRPSPRL